MKRALLILAMTLGLGMSAMAQRGGGSVTTATGVDSLLLMEYKEYEADLQSMIDEYGKLTDEKKKEKLAKKYDKLQAKCDDALVGIYAKYIEVPGVIQRLFAIRTSVDKEQLQKIYSKIPASLQTTDPYAASLKQHIDGYQVQQGDQIGDFGAFTSKGYKFNYSEFKEEKDVLLIFGDFASMGLDIWTTLCLLYKDVDKGKLEFISFMSVDNAEDLSQEAITRNVEWLSTSDFKGDHSPLRISFGVTAEPTLVYISKGGVITYMTAGIDDAMVELIQAASYK